MANFKFPDAEQAKIIYNYERTKEKLYKNNVALGFVVPCIFNHSNKTPN